MNRVKELFGIKYPIIQGGMLWCSGWRLASAVSNAEGLGLIGSAIYGMVLFQSSFQGTAKQEILDLSHRELLICSSLFLMLLVIGLYPNLLLNFSFGV